MPNNIKLSEAFSVDRQNCTERLLAVTIYGIGIVMICKDADAVRLEIHPLMKVGAVAQCVATFDDIKAAEQDTGLDFVPEDVFTLVKNTVYRTFDMMKLFTEAEGLVIRRRHRINWSEIVLQSSGGYKQEGVCSACGAVVVLLNKPPIEHAAIEGTAVDNECAKSCDVSSSTPP